MNRAISTWKKMFFKNNIGKIRKTVMDYLKEEGVKVEMENGLVIVGGDECYYTIDFDLEGEYPLCSIVYRVKGEDYESLEISQKTFAANQVNTEEIRHSVVKAFNDEVVVDTYFYFNDKNMLLDLFYDYFTDLKDTAEEVCGYLGSMIRDNKEKRQQRPIGFTINATARDNKKDSKISACNEQDME